MERAERLDVVTADVDLDAVFRARLQDSRRRKDVLEHDAAVPRIALTPLARSHRPHAIASAVAPPLEVYHRPLTRFVGEFIGDSNIFPGTVDPSLPGCVVVDGLGPIQADVDACRRIGPGPVDVLVRPERVQLVALPGTAVPANRTPMTIDVIVNYGESVLVIGTTHGRRLRMRIAGARPDAVCEGATVTVGWRPEDAHLIARSSRARS